MIKKNTIQEEIELKKLFNSIETEKPSDDFTLMVMERVAKESIVPARPKFEIPRFYYFLFIPLLIVIGFIPFLINILSEINFEFRFPTFPFFETWLAQFIENMQRVFTPSVLSITIACLIISIFFLFANIADSIKES